MKVSFGVMQLSLLRPVRTVTRQVWTGACQKDLQKMVWSGLGHWREAGVDHRRTWTRNGPIAKDLSFNQNAVLPRTLPECGELVLNTSDPIKKAQLTHQIYSNLKDGKIEMYGKGVAPNWRARPKRPQLVSPNEVPTMKDSLLPKCVYTLHSLAHIELNAIDLAWDTLVRFAPLKLWEDFYVDFAHVADDESRHFCWCEQRMNELGYGYGDQPVHSILWRSAQDSHHDVTARLALVSMGQEARGLNEGPRLAARLASMKDRSSARLVERIAQEEKAHVAVGLVHFLQILHLLGEDPGVIYRSWIQHLSPFLMGGKYDHGAREEVGLSRSWYDPQEQ